MPIFGITASSNMSTKLTDFYQIATTTVGSGGAASVTFNNIPQTYSHLQIRFIARTNRADVTDVLTIRYNNDTSNSNYTYHEVGGLGATLYAYGAAQPERNSLSMGAGASAGSNIFGVGIGDVLDYANTNKYKTVKNTGGADNNGSGRVALASGVWLNTAAITRIDLSPGAGTSFSQYSSFQLYGVM